MAAGAPHRTGDGRLVRLNGERSLEEGDRFVPATQAALKEGQHVQGVRRPRGRLESGHGVPRSPAVTGAIAHQPDLARDGLARGIGLAAALEHLARPGMLAGLLVGRVPAQDRPLGVRMAGRQRPKQPVDGAGIVALLAVEAGEAGLCRDGVRLQLQSLLKRGLRRGEILACVAQIQARLCQASRSVPAGRRPAEPGDSTPLRSGSRARAARRHLARLRRGRCLGGDRPDRDRVEEVPAIRVRRAGERLAHHASAHPAVHGNPGQRRHGRGEIEDRRRAPRGLAACASSPRGEDAVEPMP